MNINHTITLHRTRGRNPWVFEWDDSCQWYQHVTKYDTTYVVRSLGGYGALEATDSVIWIGEIEPGAMTNATKRIHASWLELPDGAEYIFPWSNRSQTMRMVR